jgi:spermidine synthase
MQQGMRSEYALFIIVFLSGAITMVLELVGSRMLAPFVGTTIYVWTSLISIVLASLSLGYFIGGKIADKGPSYKKLSLILLFAAEAILLIIILRDPLFSLLQEHISDVRTRAVLATIALFSLPSFLFGIISPYAVKLKLHSIRHSASTVGNLYAIATIGSIVGTILAGFFLISYLSITQILLFLSLTTLIASILAYAGAYKGIKIVIFFLLLLGVVWEHTSATALANQGMYEKQTTYQSVRVFVDADPLTNRPIKVLGISGLWHSAQFLDSDELVFSYLRHYRLADHFNSDLHRALMVGGGAYTYPRDFLKKHPESVIDVVEIDPALVTIAKEHFGLEDDPRMHIFHTDGRIFINETKNTYDVIFLDAYGKYDIPFHMATAEFANRMYQVLGKNGIVIANIISSIEGRESGVLKTNYKALSAVFPHVYIIPTDTDDVFAKQNVMLIALKSPAEPSSQSTSPELQSYLDRRVQRDNYAKGIQPLTDDFAPLELYSL